MDMNPDDETFYTTQYQEAILKYVENEYCAKHRCVLVNQHQRMQRSNLVPSATALASSQSFFDAYDLSSDDEKYSTPNDVAEMTPGRSNRAAPLLTAARLCWNSPPEAPKNWGQINPNLNDYHSDPLEICSTFWLTDIADWWRQQDEMHSKFADHSNVARNSFSIIPHGVGVEATFALGWHVIGCRKSKTSGETLRKTVIVMHFARASNGILAGPDPELDTMNKENDSEMKKDTVEKTFHRRAKVHDFLETWQGSHNLHATQEESGVQHKQMTTVGFISDTDEIVKASWSLLQHGGAAAFKLSERSPLPPPVSANDHPGGRTQILNVDQIRKINRHPVECDEDSTPESISDSEDWLNCNGDLDNPNDSEDDCGVTVESDIEQDNSIEDSECPEQRNVSATPNSPCMIGPTRKSTRQAENVLRTVNAIETRRNKGVKKTCDRMCQCFTSFFMYLDREFKLVIY